MALVLAHRVASAYPDAQLFVDLRGTSDTPLSPAEALQRAIQSFEPEAKLPDNVEELRARYNSRLHGKKALILADNAAGPEQVRPLIPPPGCLLLVTSRRHFLLEGLFDLPLDKLPEPDAVELLLTICRRIGDCAARIAELCGRLPLALRAAAGLLKVRPDIAVDRYVEDLADERTRLERIGDEGVELGVEASLNLSYRQLVPEVARVFRLLSVFPATFDAAAEEQVCQDPDHAALGELLRSSLVEFDTAKQRYRLHDLVRIFAARRLGEPPHAADRLPAELRHAKHYRAVLTAAHELYLKGRDGVLAGLALADADWSNIQSGAAWTRDHGETSADALGLVSAYPGAGINVLSLRLHPREMVVWLQAAVSAARKLGDRRGEGSALGNLGLAYAHLGEARRAIEFHEQALAISREIGDRRAEGYVSNNLGLAYAQLGEARRAIEFYEQTLAISREIGDRLAEGQDLGNLGLAYAHLGEPRRAIEFYEQRLQIARDIGDRRGEGNALGNLGNAYAALGEARRAIEFHEQALVISREIGDRRGEGNALNNLGIAYADLGEARRAIEFYEQRLQIARDIGDRRGEGNALGNLGNAYAALGEARRAIEFYKQHLAIARAIGDRRGEGNALGNLGNAYAHLGEPRRAIEFYEQTLAISREIGDRRGEGNALGNLGLVYAHLGEPRRAIEFYEQRLQIARDIGDRRGEAETCWNMGVVYERLGDLPRAVELMQVCVDYERELGHPDADKDAAQVAALRAQLKSP